MIFCDLEMRDALADLEDDTMPDMTFLLRQAERLSKCSDARMKEEMLDYMVDLINCEFGGETEKDAIRNWEKYKAKHKIKRMGDLWEKESS